MDKFDWECWNHYGTEQKFRKIGNKIDEIAGEYNKHRKEYTAVLDRIEDILDRLRQLGG